MALLEIKDLNVFQDRNRQIIRNVNFQVNDGEIFCLVGRSGTGKSVIAKAILQILPPELQRFVSGTVTFDSRSLLGLTHQQILSVRGRGIGMIFQDSLGALNPVYKVRVQMADVFRKYTPKIGRKELRKQSIALLRQVDIERPEEVLEQYPFELSGGMCQRIMIAIALIQRPQLLIADEPTTSLDVITQKKILAVLQRLNQELHMSILFITHDLGVVHQIADRIGVIDKGQIVETQTRDNLFAAPQAAYTKALLANMLRVPALEDER